MRFCDENMLQHIESGASSFAERDSTFGERALEHILQKYMLFCEKNMLQHIDLEQILIAWVIPPKR